MRLFFKLAVCTLFAANLLSAAKLSWDRTEVDLEMEPEQEEIEAIFKVTNEGDERIRIARVKTSCGCTGSIIDRKILNPGESTEIKGTFNKGKRQGLNRILLEVFIDSQADPVATLKMNVKVPRLIDTLPQIAHWSSSNTKGERRIAVSLDQRYVDEITEIEYDSNKLSIIQEPDPNGTAAVILKITPKSYEELYRGTVMIHAKGKDGRKAKAKVMTLVIP